MNHDRRTLLKNSTVAALAGALPSVVISQDTSTGKTTLTGSNTWRIGGVRCTALLDGVVQVDAGIFSSADPDQLAALLAEAGQPEGKIDLDVNAYLLEVSGERILVDTGTHDLYGPSLGKLPEQLAQLGIAPNDIDKVLLTHMHNDHTGGLTTSDGKAQFRHAELIVPAAEWDYWTNEDVFEQAEEGLRFSFTGARAAATAYQDRVRVFEPGNHVVSGIDAIGLPGHSIGHTGYRISSGRDQMIIWGDAVVSPDVQFEHPNWASGFDADAIGSIDSRKRIFDEVATDKIFVAGMHLPFPGTGYVSRKKGGYRFQPAT